jgi:hypothetical protein
VIGKSDAATSLQDLEPRPNCRSCLEVLAQSVPVIAPYAVPAAICGLIFSVSGKSDLGQLGLALCLHFDGSVGALRLQHNIERISWASRHPPEVVLIYAACGGGAFLLAYMAGGAGLPFRSQGFDRRRRPAVSGANSSGFHRSRGGRVAPVACQ